ncbi:hypothetical protein CDL15_Pgr005159 [Punica granatum]|uniref:Uncharacterized protein n=1 Tax=Punica granatum TaxID=22663 RepID=A0A218WQ23_PUNGR|nr:hypothetical protein CDL15_Pgr005159 [Punica granatum]
MLNDQCSLIFQCFNRIRLTIIWSISFHRHFTSGFVFSSSNPSKKRKSWWQCRSGSWNVGWGERPAIGGGPRGEGRGPRFTQEEVEDSVLGVDEDDLVVDVLRLWTLKPRKGLVVSTWDIKTMPRHAWESTWARLKIDLGNVSAGELKQMMMWSEDLVVVILPKVPA